MEPLTTHLLVNTMPEPAISPDLAKTTGLVLLFVALYALYRALLPKPIPGIPYDKSAAHSILGDLPFMLRTIKTDGAITWFIAQARKHKAPLCQVLQPFGGKPFVLLTDFREAQDVLLRQSKVWDRSDFSIALLSGMAPHHHINLKTGPAWKAHRRLLPDLMTPAFLRDVAAPNIYQSAMQLVDLWRLRAAAADGRPFEAVRDIYYAALDAVLEFSFADSFPHRALVPQVLGAREMDAGEVGKLRKDADGRRPGGSGARTSWDAVVEFPVAPLHESVKATMRASEMVGDIIQSPEPTLAWWWKSLIPKERRYRNTRNASMEEQVRKAVERHREARSTEKDGSDDWMKAAVDLMVHRETILAEKEGRDPMYWTPVMRDEVSSTIPLFSRP